MNQPNNDELIVNSLSVVENRVSGVVSAAGEEYEALCNWMDDLYEQGVSPTELSVIQDRINALANTNQVLTAAFQSAIEAARVMHTHAAQLADALERYKQAIADLDTNLPEARLIYQRAYHEAEVEVHQAIYQSLPNEIYLHTGLSASQAKRLVDLITDEGGSVSEFDQIWDNLAAWIDEAEDAVAQAEEEYLESTEDL